VPHDPLYHIHRHTLIRLLGEQVHEPRRHADHLSPVVDAHVEHIQFVRTEWGSGDGPVGDCELCTLRWKHLDLSSRAAPDHRVRRCGNSPHPSLEGPSMIMELARSSLYAVNESKQRRQVAAPWHRPWREEQVTGAV
jgi:hypothetical protein